MELYYFVSEASANPTFYADLRNPQSLNKYQYGYNNPGRYVDPDGHAPDQNPQCKCPTDQQIIDEVTSALDTVADATGIIALADWLRTNVPAAIKHFAGSQKCLDPGTCGQQIVLQQQIKAQENSQTNGSQTQSTMERTAEAAI